MDVEMIVSLGHRVIGSSDNGNDCVPPHTRFLANAYTEFDEIWKASYTGHGRFNVTTDNGDKLYYTYETKGPSDTKKPASNAWKIVNGTGKHKDTKGSGTCEGTRHDDGSSDWTCTGTYSMAK